MSHHLRQAAAKGDLAKVQARLAKGDDVNAPHGYSGRTALTEAAIAGHLDVARLLLDHGADINWRDLGGGLTPLGWASSFGHVTLVELFLNKGADIELGNEYLISPLMWAAGNGHTSVVQMLLNAGANVNATATDGRTALSIAKTNKRDPVVALLKKSGGEIITLPEPAKIPWPDVDETGEICDHTTPERVLRGFIFAMNRWERNAAKLAKSKKPHDVQTAQMRDSAQMVFDRFCTAKKRPYGRSGGTYQTPPEYDPETESLLAVALVDSARAELITRGKHQHEYLYVALKKKGRWLLDSKRTRSIGGKWLKWFL